MPSLQSNIIDQFINGAGSGLGDGELVRVSGNSTVARASAATAAGVSTFVGVTAIAGSVANGGRLNVVLGGPTRVLMETGLTPIAGQLVYVSGSVAGRGTNVEPSANALAIGIVKDATGYSTSNPYVVVDIGTDAVLAMFEAAWSLSVVRFYFVDNENGSDANPGYIDAAANTTFTPAETSAVALKTSEELRNRVPRSGAGRSAAILFKPRSDGGTYLNKSGGTDYLDVSYDGYAIFVMRGSDLTNSTNDKFDLGGIIDVPGPNADLSWTVQSVSSFTITVASGNFPAELSCVGRKFQFTGNVTSAARTQSQGCCQRPSATQVDTGGSQTLANGDTFYLTTPGVRFDNIIGSPGRVVPQPNTSEVGMCLAGFRFNNTIQTTWQGVANVQFLRFDSSVTWFAEAQVVASTNYRDESNTSRAINCSIDFRSSVAFRKNFGNIRNCAFQSTVQYSPALLPPINSVLFTACFCNGNVRVGGLNVAPQGSTFSYCTIGQTESNTFHNMVVRAGLTIDSCRVAINGIDLAGSSAGIAFAGNNDIFINGVTGALAAGSVLDLSSTASGSGATGAFQSRIRVVGAGITATPGAGGSEVLSPGAVSATIAQLAQMDFRDNAGNQLVGTGKVCMGSAVLCTNNSGGTLPIGSVVRVTGDSAVTSAQANTAANATSVIGVTANAAANGAGVMVVTAGHCLTRFAADPAVPNVAYLDTGTAGQAQVAVPAAAATNQKLRLGTVVDPIGGGTGLAIVGLRPEIVPVLADGAA